MKISVFFLYILAKLKIPISALPTDRRTERQQREKTAKRKDSKEGRQTGTPIK